MSKMRKYLHNKNPLKSLIEQILEEQGADPGAMVHTGSYPLFLQPPYTLSFFSLVHSKELA